MLSNSYSLYFVLKYIHCLQIVSYVMIGRIVFRTTLLSMCKYLDVDYLKTINLQVVRNNMNFY